MAGSEVRAQRGADAAYLNEIVVAAEPHPPRAGEAEEWEMALEDIEAAWETLAATGVRDLAGLLKRAMRRLRAIRERGQAGVAEPVASGRRVA